MLTLRALLCRPRGFNDLFPRDLSIDDGTHDDPLFARPWLIPPPRGLPTGRAGFMLEIVGGGLEWVSWQERLADGLAWLDGSLLSGRRRWDRAGSVEEGMESTV